MIQVTVQRKHVMWLVGILIAAFVLIPTASWAANRFNDVPDDHPFHADTSWLAQEGITLGCGGGNFCPEDFVTRQQMSSFLRRLAENQVVDADTNRGVSILAAGTVASDGTVKTGTGNFTVSLEGTGEYRVTIKKVFFNYVHYVTVVTPIATRRMARASGGVGQLEIGIRDDAGVAKDSPFSFVVYDPTPNW